MPFSIVFVAFITTSTFGSHVFGSPIGPSNGFLTEPFSGFPTGPFTEFPTSTEPFSGFPTRPFTGFPTSTEPFSGFPTELLSGFLGFPTGSLTGFPTPTGPSIGLPTGSFSESLIGSFSILPTPTEPFSGFPTDAFSGILAELLHGFPTGPFSGFPTPTEPFAGFPTGLFGGFPTLKKRAMNPDQVVVNIDDVTDKSSELNTVVQSITAANIVSTAPASQLIRGFNDIIKAILEDNTRKVRRQTEAILIPATTTISAAAPKATSTVTYTKSEQFAICNSFHLLVEILLQLLTTVIGKNSVLSSTPFLEPVGKNLRSFEGVVDTFAFSIIVLVPACAESATDDKNNLDHKISEAIDTYSPIKK